MFARHLVTKGIFDNFSIQSPDADPILKQFYQISHRLVYQVDYQVDYDETYKTIADITFRYWQRRSTNSVLQISRGDQIIVFETTVASPWGGRTAFDVQVYASHPESVDSFLATVLLVL